MYPSFLFRGMLGFLFFVKQTYVQIKSHVRNNSTPEDLVVEGYPIEECLWFASHYLDIVKIRGDAKCRKPKGE